MLRIETALNHCKDRIVAVLRIERESTGSGQSWREEMRHELKALRMQAGERLDPNTARVWWQWGCAAEANGGLNNVN